MADHLADRLRITFGLTDNPSPQQIADWAALTQGHIESGEDQTTAGRRAALEVFGELDAILYFSQADTIASLLAQARAKG